MLLTWILGLNELVPSELMMCYTKLLLVTLRTLSRYYPSLSQKLTIAPYPSLSQKLTIAPYPSLSLKLTIAPYPLLHLKLFLRTLSVTQPKTSPTHPICQPM